MIIMMPSFCCPIFTDPVDARKFLWLSDPLSHPFEIPIPVQLQRKPRGTWADPKGITGELGSKTVENIYLRQRRNDGNIWKIMEIHRHIGMNWSCYTNIYSICDGKCVWNDHHRCIMILWYMIQVQVIIKEHKSTHMNIRKESESFPKLRTFNGPALKRHHLMEKIVRQPKWGKINKHLIVICWYLWHLWSMVL